MSEAKYIQKAKIGNASVDVQRHEVWAEDYGWNRFKFVMFIIGSVFVLLALWTHFFGMFGSGLQQQAQPTTPSVVVNTPPPTIVAPVVVQSTVPALPIARPPQPIPKPVPATNPPIKSVEPAPKPPKLYW